MWYDFLIGAKRYQVNINIFWFLLRHQAAGQIFWVFGVKNVPASLQSLDRVIKQS